VAETLVFAGVAFLVITVAAAVFLVWVALKVVRGVVRLLVGAMGGPPPYRQIVVAPQAPRLPPVRIVCCGHIRCRATNPEGARYCRRCGMALLHPAGAAVASQPRRPQPVTRELVA
jgi:hypothetical protein